MAQWKSSAEFEQYSDPEALLLEMQQAWVDGVSNRSTLPWDSLALICSFGEGTISWACYAYDGIVEFVQPLRGSGPLMSPDAFMRLRELTATSEGRMFTTTVWTYVLQTEHFTHEYIWGDDKQELDININREDAKIFRSLRPVEVAEMEEPVSLPGAVTLIFRSQAMKTCGVVLERSGCTGDKLAGGWRVYTPLDPALPRPLPSMDDALEHTVYLVTDTGEVTYTTAPVDEHDRLIAELD